MNRPVRKVRRVDESAATSSEVVQADLFSISQKAPKVDNCLAPPGSARPIRRAAKSPTSPESSPGRPSCPECGAPDPKIRSVEGGSKPNLLRTRWECRDCGHVYPSEKIRRDVCAHGVVKFVPCEACGRTWDSIFEGPDYRPEFHPRGKVET